MARSPLNEEQAYYALTQKAFGLLAPAYELMTLPLTRVREQVVDFAEARRGLLVLDVATGTGQQALAFAKRGCRVVGVDLTDAMLAIARRHNKHGLVEFEQGDATHLRFEDSSFDITCISYALHDMPPTIRESVLSEMVRVTRNNGKIIIVDYAVPRAPIARTLLQGITSLYEGRYYREFLAADLPLVVTRSGIEILDERPVLLGAGRIVRGQKRRP